MDSLLKLIDRLKAVTDEVVIILDNTDELIIENLKKTADSVKTIPGKGYFEHYVQDIIDSASFGWILRIDDDEMLDDSWTREELKRLISDKYATHYLIPRRWMISNNKYISTMPHFPDYQLRLFRNIPGIITIPQQVHQQMEVAGEIRRIDHLTIDHYDLMFNKTEERLRKTEFYSEINFNKSAPTRRYYMYEDYKFGIASTVGLERAELNKDFVPVCDNAYSVIVTSVIAPDIMIMGLTYTAKVKLKNMSNKTYYPASNMSPTYNKNVYVSYHVYGTDDPDNPISYDNARFSLPSILKPNEALDVLVMVDMPLQDGLFYIQFDLVEEGVTWFSHHNDISYYPFTSVKVENGYGFSCSELAEKKKLFFVGTPEHGNISDHAIAISSLKFFEDYFPEYYVIEYTTGEMQAYFPFIDSVLNDQDVIFLCGGGNLGNTYLTEEEPRRSIIKRYKNNRKTILPQSIYFTDDEAGKNELQKSVDAYNDPNLLVIARGEKSYDFIKSNFIGCNHYLAPDMFLYYSKFMDSKPSGEDVLVILRTESECCIDRDKVLDILDSCSLQYRISDLNYDNPQQSLHLNIKKEEREYYFQNKIKEIEHSKLVITDRLHGILFAVAMRVPCIALKSADHKNEEIVKWFSGGGCVYLGENIKELPNIIEKLLHVKVPEGYSFDTSLFLNMANHIKLLIQNVSE